MFLYDTRETDYTFSEPGSNAPFSWGAFNPAEIPGGDWTDPAAMDKGINAFMAGVRAAERQTRLVDIVNARENALAEAADHRIRTVKDQTGIELENPFRGGYAIEARRRIREELAANGGTLDEVGVPTWQRKLFEEKIAEVAANAPDKAAALDFGQSLEDQAQAISKSATWDGENIDGGFMASLAGGFMGSVTGRDPLFLSSLFAGPGLSNATTTAGRIAFGALKQGLFNAGLQALAQPTVQDWRRTIGERNGVVPAIENVGMAFVLGAIPGAGIEGFRAVNANVMRRIADGTPRASDVESAGRALGSVDDDAVRQVRVADQDVVNDAAIEAMPGVPAAEHADIVAQATRHAEDPETNPPPDIPIIAPARKAAQARVLDESQPSAIGDVHTVDGKPVAFARFSPDELSTDAAAFQYKGGGDAAGVTDRLKHVTQFDPLASGKTLVFERNDGTRVIADGHQRLGLAKRLGASDTSIRLDGFLFREADGWTPEDVRALAAKKNMQEGSGDAIDAARVLRDRPDLLDGSLPLSSPMMKNAIALARLSDEAFGMAINGVVPPNYAAAVGSMVPDKLQHSGVLADLVRFAPETEREARVLIGEIMASGFRAEEQINLFGAAEATRSLMGERVKVLDSALQGLVKDRKLFGTLAEKADAIEAAGNQLARSVNDARARDAAQLSDMLVRLARRTGPVSDALNRVAALHADGQLTRAKAADAFLDDVRGLLDRDGLSGLLASPELKPAVAIEPGTPDAAKLAEGSSAESTGALFDEPAPKSAAAENPVPAPSLTVRDFIGGQRGVTAETLSARAAVLQAELNAAKVDIEAAGGLFVDPGPKKLATIAEKIARKGYKDASQITDAARAGVVVDSPAQADAAVAALAARFEVFDEGWNVNDLGYTDRKLLVRGADGTVGEFQIIPAAMYEAKKGGGQQLYTQARAMAPGPEQDALNAQQVEIYSAASARFSSDWAGIFEVSSSPNSSANVSRQRASGSTDAVSRTSMISTGDQGAPGSSTAKAAERSSSNTAGRQSQLQNVKGMDNNVGASPDAGKAEPSLFDDIVVSGREDGKDAVVMMRDDALADADRIGEHADLVDACKG